MVSAQAGGDLEWGAAAGRGAGSAGCIDGEADLVGVLLPVLVLGNCWVLAKNL